MQEENIKKISDREALRKWTRDYYHKNKFKIKAQHRALKQKARIDVINGYGGCCNCCGESNTSKLTIDHKLKDGNILRKTNKHTETGYPFYSRLIKEHFPSSYRILCWNCNLSHGKLGYCPHKSNSQYKDIESLPKSTAYRRKLRLIVFDGYGNKCTKCNEVLLEFLSIAHLNNDGAAERKDGLYGYKFYKYIIENKFPDIYTLLCHNCNASEFYYDHIKNKETNENHD